MKFTVIASINPQVLSKRYSLDGTGNIRKTTSAKMVEGTAHVVQVDSLQSFADELTALTPNQALAFGVTLSQTAKMLSKEAYKAAGCPRDTITRTRDNFGWPVGSGVLLLDYDPRESCVPLDRDTLIAALAAAAPSLEDAGKVWWVSSSSFVYNGDEPLNGLKGQRVYIGVKDATDIPRAGKVLADRLWLAGHGYYAISKSSSLLERCLVDTAVWQPERLDFAAGAICSPPLRQDRGKPIVFDGPLWDTKAALPDLSVDEAKLVAVLKRDARESLKDEQQLARVAYIEDRAREIAGPNADDDALGKARNVILRALDKDVLTGEFPIVLADGRTVTVGEMLDDPNRYHLVSTRDPLEPDYNSGHAVGKVYLFNGRPTLSSFAHGKRVYKLIRQPSRVELVRGRTSDAVDTTVEILVNRTDMFSFGESIAAIRDDKVLVPNEHSLAYLLGSTIQYWNWKKVGDNLAEVNEDPPMKLVKSLMAMPSSLKPLEGVIDAPLVLKDGRLLTTVGYDPESRLYLVSQEMWSVPDNPTESQVKSALDALMFPFNSFPFVSSLDRGIFLASLLTAIERPALPAAPAFGFDAPVQGSGKTLLAGCVGALLTGEKVPITPHTAGRDDEETRKRLFSALMGGDKVMLWDNILGVFDSAALAGLLTCNAFKDRVLGQSKESAFPNRMLVLLTGNNLCLAGDMPRRTLVARIDPKTDQPFARSFDLDPLDYVLRNRNKMIVAGLTVIQGWLQSSDYMLGITAKGRTASFEVWDDLVRQPVAWVNRVIAPNQYGDPMDAILEAQNSDPEQEALRGFLKSMITTFGKERVTAKKIVEKCSDYSAFSSTNDLKEAIIDMTGSDRLTTRGVGRMMKYRKDRVAGGMVLRMKDRWDGAVWWVERVEAALSVVGGDS